MTTSPHDGSAGSASIRSGTRKVSNRKMHDGGAPQDAFSARPEARSMRGGKQFFIWRANVAATARSMRDKPRIARFNRAAASLASMYRLFWRSPRAHAGTPSRSAFSREDYQGRNGGSRASKIATAIWICQDECSSLCRRAWDPRPTGVRMHVPRGRLTQNSGGHGSKADFGKEWNGSVVSSGVWKARRVYCEKQHCGQ